MSLYGSPSLFAPALSLASLRFCADARFLCLTLALMFVWSFVFAPTAIAAEQAHRDYLAHQPKPLPTPRAWEADPIRFHNTASHSHS